VQSVGAAAESGQPGAFGSVQRRSAAGSEASATVNQTHFSEGAVRYMPNINNLMKQAQAMQANMAKAQAEIATIEVIGEAGGGMVKITMTGKHEVKRVQIEPAVVGEDREMLEDLVAAATNDAVHKVEARVAEKMSSLTAGLQLPPGMKLPF
jgi:DNA-binding YbaB/EbfC family protein